MQRQHEPRNSITRRGTESPATDSRQRRAGRNHAHGAANVMTDRDREELWAIALVALASVGLAVLPALLKALP